MKLEFDQGPTTEHRKMKIEFDRENHKRNRKMKLEYDKESTTQETVKMKLDFDSEGIPVTSKFFQDVLPELTLASSSQR